MIIFIIYFVPFFIAVPKTIQGKCAEAMEINADEAENVFIQIVDVFFFLYA